MTIQPYKSDGTLDMAYIVLAAEEGYTKAQMKLGFTAYFGERGPQNYEQAVFWFRTAAEKGDIEGAYYLGLCYYFGHGVSQSYEQAAGYFQIAARKNHVRAQYLLGHLLKNQDIAENLDEAIFWLTKAAEQGEVEAQRELGICYREGVGVKQDDAEALRWLYLSGKNCCSGTPSCLLSRLFEPPLVRWKPLEIN